MAVRLNGQVAELIRHNRLPISRQARPLPNLAGWQLLRSYRAGVGAVSHTNFAMQTIHTKRCATRVTGRLGTKRRCKRTAELITPGEWWHCWQHKQPGQTVHLWFGAHPRDLHVVHYWVSENGLAMRLCDGDNSEDAPPPTHDCADDAVLCAVCQDIYLDGMDRFRTHYSNDFGDEAVY